METKKILIADDEDDLVRILEKRLSDIGYQVYKASDGVRALEVVKDTPPDLILLDIMMPHLDGLEVKDILNRDAATAAIPVIFLTAKSTIADKTRGLRQGADDYITKPFDFDELLARVDAALSRRQFYEDLSMRDGLTGLYNFNFFKKQFSLFFSMSVRYHRVFSIAIADVDNFKKINDTYGHTIGDSVLIKVAQALRDTLRGSDIITRYGGDEFAVIFPESDEAQTDNAMKRVKERIDGKVFAFDEGRSSISFSISSGVATFSRDFTAESQMFDAADTRMYKEKKGKE